MNNADKNTKKKKPINTLKNKIKKDGINGKAKAPKFRNISEAFYNGLVEQCIINETAITVVEKSTRKQK